MPIFLNDLDKFASGTGRYSITHDKEKKRPIWRARLLFVFRSRMPREQFIQKMERIEEIVTRYKRSMAVEDHGDLLTITIVPTLQ